LVAAPVAASAQFDGMRASTSLTSASALQDGEEVGGSNWLLLLAAAAAMTAGFATLLGNHSDNPTSV
jgi:hypothetical protein